MKYNLLKVLSKGEIHTKTKHDGLPKGPIEICSDCGMSYTVSKKQITENAVNAIIVYHSNKGRSFKYL